MEDRNACLREAAAEDAELLFVWRNEKTTRANSFHTTEIPYGDHERWFSEVLERDDVTILIYEVDGVPAGQVRLTEEGGCVEISYSVDKKWRGHGHATRMLALIEDYLKDKQRDTLLVARVRPENVASIRVFEHLKYRMMNLEDEIRFSKQIE